MTPTSPLLTTFMDPAPLFGAAVLLAGAGGSDVDELGATVVAAADALDSSVGVGSPAEELIVDVSMSIDVSTEVRLDLAAPRAVD